MQGKTKHSDPPLDSVFSSLSLSIMAPPPPPVASRLIQSPRLLVSTETVAMSYLKRPFTPRYSSAHPWRSEAGWHQRLVGRGRHVLFGCNGMQRGGGRPKALTLCETKCVFPVSCIRHQPSAVTSAHVSHVRRRVIFHFLRTGNDKICTFHVESAGEDVRDLQTISLSCWCNRHIFQDVAACGPRLCLSRMTPFTSIRQRPARPPLTSGLCLCETGRTRGRDRFERSDGMQSVVCSQGGIFICVCESQQDGTPQKLSSQERENKQE